MPYADQQYMDDYFGNAEVLIAADRDGSGSVDQSVVRNALDSASEEIDSYVGVKYDLPLSTKLTTEVLKRISADIAMYRMSVTSHSLTEEKRIRYEDAIKWLVKLSMGQATLGAEEETETADDLTVKSTSSEPRLFSRTKMRGLT